MTRTPLRLLAYAALLSVLGACSDSPTEPPVDPAGLVATDVAVMAGDQTFEDVVSMRHYAGVFDLRTVALPRLGAWVAACSYDSTTERFECPDATHGEFTHSRWYQLFDANGTPQPAFDSATTASATFSATLSGAVARQGFSATVTRQRTFTVSGLAGVEVTRTWNGSGATAQARTRHGEGRLTRTYEMTSSTVVTNVIVPVPPAAQPWPLSGIIVREISFTREGATGHERSGHRTVTITFNGTQFVPMTVNDRSFTLDLATGHPVRD